MLWDDLLARRIRGVREEPQTPKIDLGSRIERISDRKIIRIPLDPKSEIQKFPGGHRRRVTPVPIPNTEVKPSTADGTARAGAWESRSLPGIYSKAE